MLNIFILLLGLTHLPTFVEPTDAAVIKSSRKAWDETKVKHGDIYHYSVVFTSAFGFGNETIIVVVNGKISERRYRSWMRPMAVTPGEKTEPKADWVEMADNIGKHKDGAPARTMEQLYDEAEKAAEQKLQPFEKRYVKTDSRGILEYAFIVDKRITDDAPRKGVNISKLKLGNEK
jgi:hypothetical protein